jgi:Uma2 family endonuclease
MATTTNLLTFEEFERLPEEANKLELIEGELVRMPPAKTNHARISWRLAKRLDAALEMLRQGGGARDLGEVLHEAGYRVGPSWMIPDASITHAGQKEGDYLEGAPALAVEIISEANTSRLMNRKVKLYLEHGAREVWLVYPGESVWIYRGRTAEQADAAIRSELLPGIVIDLAPLFGQTEQ